MIEIRKTRSDERSGSKARSYRIIFACTIAGLALGTCQAVYAQGMATGGTAVSARPLPPGIKAPGIRYEDVAARAGFGGGNVSGGGRGQQYILESKGNGVANLHSVNQG